MEFERFKKFWEKPEERVVTSNNVSSWDSFWDRLVSEEDNFSIPSVSNTRESLIKTSPHTCVSDALDESRTYYYERIDMEIINKVIGDFFNENGSKEKITWIDMAEKDTIESYKRQQIDGILMGKSKYKMKRNRLEMEMIALRDSTEENYMLNKMVNTDGNEFFVEYTLYKDYDKYFGLTLEGDSIEVVNIMEEEFAEFLHQYRLSITYPQVQAVHEDEDKYLEIDVNNSSNLTIEEYLEYVKLGMVPIQGVGSEDTLVEDLIATVVKAKQLIEAYKRQLEEGKLTKFSPMYDENDIEDEIELSGNIAGDSPYISSISSMWGISDTTVSKEHLWTGIKVDGEYDMNKSGVNVDHGSDLDIDKTYVNIPSMWTETPTNTGEMTKNSWTETSSNTSGVRAGMWKSNQPIEDNSKESFISKIVADVMEELLTKGTCSLNITLGQE